MNIFIRFMAFTCVLVLSSTIPSFSAIDIEKGDKFVNNNRRTYLRCREVLPKRPGEETIERVSLDIHVKDALTVKEKDLAKGLKVGSVSVTYNPSEQRVGIVTLDVLAPYRRHHFGTEALQSVLGIFRSPKRKDLKFKEFYLTVHAGNPAAKTLYENVGFKEINSFADQIEMALGR